MRVARNRTPFTKEDHLALDAAIRDVFKAINVLWKLLEGKARVSYIDILVAMHNKGPLMTLRSHLDDDWCASIDDRSPYYGNKKEL